MSDFDVAEFHYKKAKRLLERAEKEEVETERQACIRLAEIHLDIWSRARQESSARPWQYRLHGGYQ